MDYEFNFQDPTSPDTVYLFEALIGAAQQATEWRGMFAFASRNGVQTLLTDPAVQGFFGRGGRLELIVGIDAVTNRATLEYLLEIERDQPNLTVRVFWNETPGLFHPKLSHFRCPGGREILIVGSGNLTPGGMRQNFEGYIILRSSRAREAINIMSLDRFINEHAPDFRPIDEQILNRAARNIITGGGRGRRGPVAVEPEIAEAAAEAVIEQREEPALNLQERILIAQVPAAGGRWHQVHFNRDVINQFFQVRPNTDQRVYLVERRIDGTLGEQEVRPCVFSQRNKNYKIELGARRDAEYPNDGVPIAVFRESQARSFEYMLIFPEELGYDELLQLTRELPTVGRGLPRVITDSGTLLRAWPGCPLVR
jgi:hypothetical protein